VDLTFSGAAYATLDAERFGLNVEPRNVDEFIRLGREVKASLGERAHHGSYGCYGVRDGHLTDGNRIDRSI